jgi:prepilin peptidase CpaA
MIMLTLLLAVGFIVTIAAIYDAATLTIPNWISLVLVALFPLVALGSGSDFTAIGIHLIIGFAALLGGMILFAFNLIGGGDAKFFAAVSLFVGLSDLASYVVVVIFVGGLLALMILGAKKITGFGISMDWFLKRTRDGAVIPYGIAISAGALVVLPETQLFAAALLQA